MDGTTVMPAFQGTFSQEAMWAIRTFIESKHEN
jgi:mono/diheme cytochrome c family protein